MTTTELQKIMSDLVALLNDNQAAATPEVLADAAGLLAQARTLEPALTAAFGMPKEKLDALFAAGDKFIDIEKRLTGGLAANLVGVLTKLQQRPLLMRIFATAV